MPRHSQHVNPFISGLSSNDAELTGFETDPLTAVIEAASQFRWFATLARMLREGYVLDQQPQAAVRSKSSATVDLSGLAHRSDDADAALLDGGIFLRVAANLGIKGQLRRRITCYLPRTLAW